MRLIPAEAARKRLPLTRICLTLQTSRASYYRWRARGSRPDPDMDLRDRVQRLCAELPAYGYRRIAAELARREQVASPKRVLRLMRDDNLLCLRRRAFWRTTDSRHGLPVYPNLAAEGKPTGIDQLWVADITYIRLEWEFVYLAAILDAFSRRCIGWALGRRLDADLALAALDMALDTRTVSPQLVHHSDRGVQYASRVYTGRLREAGIQISMSRVGNPYDNARMESFWKTLKAEEVWRTEYADVDDAEDRIGSFLEQIYNTRRLHSALGYRPPAEFEQTPGEGALGESF